VKNFVPVSCKTGRNLERLREIVVALAQSTNWLAKELYPLSFFQLETLIIEERKINDPPIVSITKTRVHQRLTSAVFWLQGAIVSRFFGLNTK